MKTTTIIKFVVEKVLSEEEKKMKLNLAYKGGKFLVSLGEEFMKVIESYFEEVYDGVVDYVDKLPELNIIQKEEYWNVDKEKYEGKIAEILKDGYDLGQHQQKISNAGLGISTDLDNDYAINWSKEHAGELITNIGITTKKEINKLITNSMSGEGMSKRDLIKKLQDSYSFSKYRSTMIVNNELGMALIEGKKKQRKEYQKKTGESGYKQRIAQEDERDCDVCDINANDGWISANEMHSSGHYNPTAHVNCRCDEQYLPFPPDGEKIDNRLNDQSVFPDYHDGMFINEDKMPKNIGYSRNAVSYKVYNAMNSRMVYEKPVKGKPGAAWMENGEFHSRMSNEKSRIAGKYTEVHEVCGHGIYLNKLEKIPGVREKVKKILEIAEREVAEDKDFDWFVGYARSNYRSIISELHELDVNYRFLEIKRYTKNKTIKIDEFVSDKYQEDLNILEDMKGLIKNEDIEGRDKGYYTENPENRIHEMTANIATVYYFGNPLLEKVLPKTYNAMINFYSDLGLDLK